MTGLIALNIALGSGDVIKVTTVSAGFPAVTLLLSAIFLAEAVTVARLAGVALVIAGAVVIAVAR